MQVTNHNKPVVSAAGEESIVWLTESLTTARQVARETGAPVLAWIYAQDCEDCKRMEEGPLQDPQVISAARSFVAVRLSRESESGAGLAGELGLDETPAFVIRNADGRVILKHTGFALADYMTMLLREGLKMAQRASGAARTN